MVVAPGGGGPGMRGGNGDLSQNARTHSDHQHSLSAEAGDALVVSWVLPPPTTSQLLASNVIAGAIYLSTKPATGSVTGD